MKQLKHIIILLLSFYSLSVVGQGNQNLSFYFIAFGDMPYNLPQDYLKFENVVKEINALKPAFTVNVGDFKSSSTPCSDESYKKILNYYTLFNKPLIYTPGDNEWTDCFKNAAGKYNPEERLNVLRKMFFKDSTSFGKEKLKLTSQSNIKGYTKFVENNKWDFGKIAFATIHIVGSNNNFLPSSNNGNKEFYEREKADLFWMENVFKSAKENNQKGIVLIIHADMFYNSNKLNDESGFSSIKKKLQELVTDFKKPVLLINGDSHLFLIDKPFFENLDKKKTLDYFTRLQVPGKKNMNAVKINIDTNSPTIFNFEELIFAEK